MAKQNNRFKILCMGVAAFTAVSAIIFASLGGGEGLQASEEQLVEGFNSELPGANVESVSDDRVTAARKEDERRKKEEMLGLNGSHFNLLEIEEKRKKEEDIDSLAREMQERTRVDLEKQVSLQEGNDVVVSNAPTYASTEDISRKREERHRQAYKDAQDIYGKEMFPDHEEEKVTAKAEPEKPKEEKEEPSKKKKGFNTMGKDEKVGTKNSIKAVFHGAHENLTNNSTVKLRLLEALKVNDRITLPKSEFIYGKVSFGNSRVMIKIDNVIYQNNTIPFKAEIYDLEGMQGIYVPDNAVNDAVKDAGQGAVEETPGITGRGGGGLGGLALNVVNKTGNAIKNAVVKSVGKNKVSISDNYLVYIKTSEK